MKAKYKLKHALAQVVLDLQDLGLLLYTGMRWLGRFETKLEISTVPYVILVWIWFQELQESLYRDGVKNLNDFYDPCFLLQLFSELTRPGKLSVPTLTFCLILLCCGSCVAPSVVLLFQV